MGCTTENLEPTTPPLPQSTLKNKEARKYPDLICAERVRIFLDMGWDIRDAQGCPECIIRESCLVYQAVVAYKKASNHEKVVRTVP